MCCCHCSCLYQKLPYLHGLTGFLEMIFGIGFHERCSPDRCSRDSCSPATFALQTHIKPKSKPKLILCLALTHTYILILIYALTLTQTCAYTLNYSGSKCRWGASVAGEQVSGEHHSCYRGKYVAAFIIDWISSAIPTLIGLFTAFIILVILWKLCACFLNNYDREKGRKEDQINTSGISRGLFRQKALRRFLIIDCNCPCYKARSRLRFQIRFAVLCIFFVLRIVAIGLYASAPPGDDNGRTLALVCGFSLIFIFNTLCLDFYRYYVWWHYTPQSDTRCHLRSKKHQRYLPYHMVGDFRDSRTLGDRPCTNRPCHQRTLDHIAVFHSNDYQPQDRWRDIPKPPPVDPSTNKKTLSCFKSEEIDNQPHYIGFHTTDPDSAIAIAIAYSEFRPGNCGWLGAGVYFARSIAETIGKAKSEGGAHIIAEIRMGKVYEIERDRIDRDHTNFDAEKYDYVHHSKWKNDYDTCYMLHDS